MAAPAKLRGMLDSLCHLAAHAYHCGEIEAGRRACERILSTPDVPAEIAMVARANRIVYTPLLEQLASPTFHRIDIDPAHDGWSLFNPTVIAHGGDLVAIVRSSNYQIVDGRYVMPEADGQTIRTENLLVRFDAELRPVSRRPLEVTYPKTEYPVDGLEDCRLRAVGTGLGVSATVRNVAPFDGRCRIAIGTIDLATATVTDLRVLDGITTQDHEKNWMPIGRRGGWVYACRHDGHVVTIDQDPDLPGGWQIVRRSPAPVIASEFRGGSQLVPFRGGWLAVIHEVAHTPRGRSYEHRFVWFDERLALASMSQPFWFRESRAIEFAAGLAILPGRVIVSFGVRDAEAWLVELGEEEAWRLLSPLTSG